MSTSFSERSPLFLSTPSARRATQSGRPDRDRCVISIHALREEGDTSQSQRHSGRRKISIHALREEGDPAIRLAGASSKKNFYPRPPRGGRRRSYLWG